MKTLAKVAYLTLLLSVYIAAQSATYDLALIRKQSMIISSNKEKLIIAEEQGKVKEENKALFDAASRAYDDAIVARKAYLDSKLPNPEKFIKATDAFKKAVEDFEAHK